MADPSRATQAAVLTGDVSAQPARATQAVVLVGAVDAQPARVTQAAVMVGVKEPVPAVATQAVVLIGVWDYPCLTHIAQCWKITRTDGTVFGFTSADIEIEYQGVTYSPCDSLSGGAIELGAELGSVGNGEIQGLISDDAISETDLAGGLFDNAVVEVWMVPFGNTSESAWRLTKGITGNVSHGRNGYTAEVLTAGALLQQRAFVETVTPSCRFELGDERCTVDLGALEESGTVTSVASILVSPTAPRRAFVDTSRAEADGYFDYGEITWVTGDNAGAVSEIKDFGSGQFTLWQPLLSPIQIGDTYTATPGCDRLKATCISKFSNFINFGGFPDVPGRDEVSQTPDAKQ